MRILDTHAAGSNYVYRWPSGNEELYNQWVDYRAAGADGEHHVRIGFGMRPTYGRDRKRVVVWLDQRPEAEFLAADDFEDSGEVLSEIRIAGKSCQYPGERIPERYTGLPVVGLPTRVTGRGVHNSWAVVANVADHRVLVALAALRRVERGR